MRKEPYSIGSYVHVVNRGSRGLSIVKDDRDRWRFLLMLRHFNDQFYPEDWFKDLIDAELVSTLKRPDTWPDQKKLVTIISFCLLDNHFHLLLKELEPDGVAKFMKRLGIGMAKYYNARYEEKGALFQGGYKLRAVNDNDYLQYLSAYIQIKNCFELHSKGFRSACQNFDQVFDWAQSYPYCSLGEMIGTQARIITDPEILSEISTAKEYKDYCRDFIDGKFENEEYKKYISDM